MKKLASYWQEALIVALAGLAVALGLAWTRTSAGLVACKMTLAEQQKKTVAMKPARKNKPAPASAVKMTTDVTDPIAVMTDPELQKAGKTVIFKADEQERLVKISSSGVLKALKNVSAPVEQVAAESPSDCPPAPFLAVSLGVVKDIFRPFDEAEGWKARIGFEAWKLRLGLSAGPDGKPAADVSTVIWSK